MPGCFVAAAGGCLWHGPVRADPRCYRVAGKVDGKYRGELNRDGPAWLWAAALASCAGPPDVAKATPLPVVSYDGQYRGTIQLTGVASGADPSWCEASPQFAVSVVNNAFVYAQPHAKVPNGGGTATYAVTVARDGTFEGQSNATGVVMGQIQGAAMTGTVDGIGCAYKFNAARL